MLIINDIDRILEPLIMWSNILGTMPYITEKMSKRYKQSALNIIQRVLYLIIYITLLCNVELKKHIDTEVFSKTSTLIFLSYFNFAANVFVMVCVMVSHQIYAKEFAAVTETVREIDKDLTRLGQQKSLFKHNAYVWKMSIAMMIYVFAVHYGILMTVLYYLAYNDVNVIQLLVFLYPTFVNTTLKINFAVWMQLIRFRFAIMNDMLEKHREDSLDKNSYPTNSSAFVKITTHLVDQHKILTKAGKSINACYGFPILACITITFVLILANTYMVLYSILNGKFNFSVVYKMTEVAYLAFELIFLVNVCVNLCKEANGTKVILLGFKIDPFKEEARNSVVASCFQLMHNKLEITASKLFNIDFTLVFSVFAATTTYLYIMLQFDVDNKVKAGNSTINGTDLNATIQ